MKIEYRSPPGTGAYTALADPEAATLDVVARFAPELSKSPQREPLARGTVPFTQDRGNPAMRLSFQVDRQHADPDAAAAFIATHVALFTGSDNFDLKVTATSAAVPQVVYLKNCAVTSVKPSEQSDKSTLFTYQFEGGTYTLTP